MEVLSIRIYPPDGSTPRIVVLEKSEATLGRSSRCDVRLPFDIVSSKHLLVRFEGEGVAAIDLGSTNGTWLNGRRLPPHQPVDIGTKANLMIVGLTLEICRVSGLIDRLTVAESATELRRMLTQALLPGPVSDDENAYIEYLDGPRRGQRAMLPDDFVEGWVGSDEAAHVNLDVEPAGADAVRVARLVREGDGFAIEPGEADGVSVTINGAPLTELVALRSGMKIVAGHRSLTFFDPLEKILDEMGKAAAGKGASGEGAPGEGAQGEALRPTLLATDLDAGQSEGAAGHERDDGNKKRHELPAAASAPLSKRDLVERCIVAVCVVLLVLGSWTLLVALEIL